MLCIASRKGLLAAAGPDSVIIASTEVVRQAYTAPGDGKIKPFNPQLTLNLGLKISQVAFSADEEFLVLSALNGGGLAVYEVQGLMQGVTQTAFEMSTNNASLRSLLPNPTIEKAELFAVVTAEGQLMVANLKSRQFVSGNQGQLLKDGVSCVSWSNKGKQLIAGLGNGSCFQMTPEGEGKAEIASPSGLEGQHHGKYMSLLYMGIVTLINVVVSSINWLENDLFLTAHTPSSEESGIPPVTTYHIITRAKPPEQGILYQKLPELSPPFGLHRTPAYQFMSRLRDFPPNLTDTIAVASTASTDISLVTRSKSPLTGDSPAEKIVNVFTTTLVTDSRRAQLPMTEGLADTSPIGFAFDLSGKDKVKRPIPGEEYDESPGPVPALMVLNNEGLLATWWLIYAESIRQGTTFPGLAVAGGIQDQHTQSQPQVSPFAAPSQSPAPAFGQASFAKPSTPLGTFGASANTAATTAFGSTSTPSSGFGAPSGLGQKQSPWGAPSTTAGIQNSSSAFGQPAFGSSAPIGATTQGTAFGMAGGLGNRPSPWGTPSTGTAAASGSAFGQTAKMGIQNSPFGTATTPSALSSQETASSPSIPASGGFASFANKPLGFAAVPSSSGDSQSIFGKPSTGSAFGSGSNTGSNFGQPQRKEEEEEEEEEGKFNGGSFKLESTFKADGTAVNDRSKSSGGAADSLFGTNFGTALGDAAPHSKDEDMNEDDDAPVSVLPKDDMPKDDKTPTSSPAPPKFLFPKSDPPKLGGLFGTQSQSKLTPAEVQNSRPAGFSFGQPTPLTITPKETAKRPEDKPRPSIETSPRIKEEPLSDEDDISPLNEEEAQPPEGYGDISKPGESSRSASPETPVPSKSGSPDAPLPPESTSKASYAPGDSSSSSKSSDDAPLPPDFAPSKTKLQEVEAAPSEGTDSPEDEPQNEDSEEEGQVEQLDDEGSGIDVGQEISPSSSKESSKITPDSSFGIQPEKSSPTKLFSSAPKEPDPRKVPLFGEVGKPAVPLFPTNPKTQESPRSPSPIRMGPISDSLRPENSRSVSAPGPMSPLSIRRTFPSQVAVPSKAQHSAEEVRRQERERLKAERAQKLAEEEQPLEDDEDEQIRRTLATEVEGTKTLDDFVAHQDYVGDVNKPGIPGQIEKVYRDINSMIDTLGLNARSLKAFVKGHEELAKSERRSRDDLEILDDWCLVEIEDLDDMESDLFEQLDDNKLPDLPRKLSDIHEAHSVVSRLARQFSDLGRTIDIRKDPSAGEVATRAPLNLDQQAQLRDLRKAFKQFQKQLSDAEEAVTMLRTRLAYAERQINGNRREGTESLKQPTVEAVEKTVRKMTGMIQKKSADIDILSSQMKDMRFPSPGTHDTIEHTDSRQGSPSILTTPNTKISSKKYQKSLPHNGYHSSVPRSPHKATPLRSRFNDEGTPRKVPGGLSEEEVDGYKAKVTKRKQVNEVVREVFARNGVKIRGLE